MAIRFNGSTQLLTGAFAPITTFPCTFACWCRVLVAAGGGSMISIDNAGTGAGYQAMTLNAPNDAPNGQRVLAINFNNGVDFAESTPNPWILNGGWALMAGTFLSATDRRAYHDGQNVGINTTSRSSSGFTRMSIASQRIGAGGTINSPLGSDLAFPTIWNVVLTATEIALLRTRHPMSVRSRSVVDCWTLADLSAASLTSLTGTRRVLAAVASPVVVPGPPVFVGRYPAGLDLDESGGAGQIFRHAHLSGLGTGGRRIRDPLT